MKLAIFLKEKGQTSIEYLLMIATVAALGTTFFNKFNGYLIENPDSYMNIQLKVYERVYNPGHGFKRFRLPR
jgi:hypothetical protein